MILSEIKAVVKKLESREALTQIIANLDSRDIILLMGMRQTGKTSLLYLLIDFLLKKKIPENNLFYFSLDDPTIAFSWDKDIKELQYFLEQQKIDKAKKIYIFIDEIQNLQNPTQFLKYYRDNFRQYKFIVTGSSSFDIRKKFKDSLAGRKKIIQINPLSFSEFLAFKNFDFKNFINLANLANLANFKNLKIDKITEEQLKKYLNEYLLFGGHPEIVKIKNQDLKLGKLKDIYNSYIQRDIKDIGQIEDIRAYNDLIQILSSQIGNLLNIQELSNALNINHLTLKKYLFLLEKTFVIYLLNPFFKNKRKEITKMPKVFCEDLGIRNMILEDFRELSLRIDTGKIAENFVFCELSKKLKILEKIFFWRTISKNEVDFVWQKGDKLIPIEVKYGRLEKPKLTTSLKNFIEEYKCGQALVVTADYFKITKFNQCQVYFVPIYLI